MRPGIDVEVTREPLGVVAAITPWNFPLAIPAWKIAPALAFGNCVVFKPAELVPASPWTLVDIVQRAGLPPGVLNLVMGPGASLGAALAASPDIDAVSFTGSQDVGPSVAAAAVKTGARVQLEMGGKNPLIVLDDADLATAVSVAVNGAFFQAGQRCTASSRLIVTEGIHDRFVEAMIERMKTLVIDDALKPGTEIGPVVDERQLEKNLEYVEIGRKEGARLAHGGERLTRDDRGLLHGAGALHRHRAGDAHQPGRDLRPGGVGHPREGLRRSAGDASPRDRRSRGSVQSGRSLSIYALKPKSHGGFGSPSQHAALTTPRIFARFLSVEHTSGSLLGKNIRSAKGLVRQQRSELKACDLFLPALLYKCGERRNLPSRSATSIPLLLSVWHSSMLRSCCLCVITTNVERATPSRGLIN